ncbi:hypothetical protein Trco_007012 [Trichoderma cornu-damae]|uniref:Uncharacterized protein n=1 Tax=Trichoderma cornu-damae TaxID=654480 RepID=A0A9P8QHI2_9HYPO|nr:hypothetical protein Trco_007012 [Trichoderma cornu-damae]
MGIHGYTSQETPNPMAASASRLLLASPGVTTRSSRPWPRNTGVSLHAERSTMPARACGNVEPATAATGSALREAGEHNALGRDPGAHLVADEASDVACAGGDAIRVLVGPKRIWRAIVA